MATAKEHGVRPYYELQGRGIPLVLVHGSWDFHHDWDLVVPALAGVLRLAGERPGLFRGLMAHEPTLFPLLADDPARAPMIGECKPEDSCRS